MVEVEALVAAADLVVVAVAVAVHAEVVDLVVEDAKYFHR
jgi:hypothetical protein